MLAGKQRIQLRPSSNSDACSQGSARPHIRCHEKDCNSRIYGGVSHFPHINLQSQKDTSSANLRIPSIHQDQHFHQIGFRPDSGKKRPAGSHQARRNRTRHSENVRWPTSFVTPFISYSGFEHDNLNGRETNLTMWVKPARIRHGSHQIINESHYTLRKN